MARLLPSLEPVTSVGVGRSRGLILVAHKSNRTLASVLEHRGYSVAMVTTSAEALPLARELRPDVIILGARLADASGLDACSALRADPFVDRSVPMLLEVGGVPSPEDRVAAVRAGAWDFVELSASPENVVLKVDTCVLAKRSIDEAIATDLVTPDARLYTSDGLAREARRVAALMARVHGALACVVFEWAEDIPDVAIGVLMARTARTSDMVGALSARRFGVVAPGTDERGAVKLALRVGEKVRAISDELAHNRTPRPSGLRLIAGWDAVSNLRYSPVDPVGLIASATSAVRSGTPDPDAIWVRAHASHTGRTSRTSHESLILERKS